MNQTYPTYSSMPQASLPQVDFSTAGMSGYYCNSSHPIAITPVGASAPRRTGESNGYIDLGGGGTEWNPGGAIGDPINGNYTAAGVPIGDVCWPMMLFLGIYLLRHIYKKKALQ